MIGDQCFVYIDDIVIYSVSFEEHLTKLRNVFTRLRQHGFVIQPAKCQFLKTAITYLGHIVSSDGLRPMEDKLDKIKQFPKPTSVKEVQMFLGLCNYYNKFIQNFSNLAQPLNGLLKKQKKEFVWTEECEKAFHALISSLTSEDLILQFPCFGKPFFLYTDASAYALGAVLTQENEQGYKKPISFASQTLNAAEKNYATIEKELLAIVWATKHFRPYLYGQTFTILSDYKPLQWCFSVKEPSSCLIRWRLKLDEFNCLIKYIPGRDNIVADALSRIRAVKTRGQLKHYKPFKPFEQTYIETYLLKLGNKCTQIHYAHRFEMKNVYDKLL